MRLPTLDPFDLEIQAHIQTLIRLKCHYPQQMTTEPFAVLAAIANGVGPASQPWLTYRLNEAVPWMKPASLPHDYRWSKRMNRGNRDDFEKSNQEFHYNLLRIAKDICGNDDTALYLKRAEAWVAMELVSCGPAWNWYKENANTDFEPGPERLAT